MGPGLEAAVDFELERSTFPFGAHLAVCEVDTETGLARLLRHVAVDDSGRVLNPVLAEGQVHGGIAQGVAQALFEEVGYDADGNCLHGNLAAYGMPSAADLPAFETERTETPTPLNPLGAKGIGESGTIGATPAVQNAVVDANHEFPVNPSVEPEPTIAAFGEFERMPLNAEAYGDLNAEAIDLLAEAGYQ